MTSTTSPVAGPAARYADTAPLMRHDVIFLRHGQTTYNAEGRMQGQLDPPLSEHGRAQARCAGHVLRALQPSVIVSSDLRRAHDTALTVAAGTGVAVTTDARLRETHLGLWQGRTKDDIDAAHPGHRALWRADALWAPEEAETQIQVGERGSAAVRDIVARHDPNAGPILLVAHGGLIIATVSALLTIPTDLRPVFSPLGNCCWAHLTTRRPHPSTPSSGTDHVDELAWSVIAWNRTAEPDRIGQAGTSDSGVQ